jgi:serine/threonine protein kinase
MSVSQCFTDIINKCLQKKPEKRPTINEIISSEYFQQKAK